MNLNIDFNEETLNVIKDAAKIAAQNNTKIYFVGGFVRDIFLGFEIKDIDIVFEGNAIEFCRKLEEANEAYNVKSTHQDFNTLKMNLAGIDIDFASTRKEEYPKSGCLPCVTDVGCSISCDLKRRDFTINAIALSINVNENAELQFEILDPYCGIEDIKAKKLRVLHDKSFIDDPTRILRALDFELRFKGFQLSREAKKLREQYLKAPDREGLSISRVELTLKKLFSDPKRAPFAFEKIIKEKLYKIYTDSTIVKSDLGKKIAKSIELINPENPEDVYLMGLKDNHVKPMLDSYKMENLTTNYEIYKRFKTCPLPKFCLYLAVTQDKSAFKFYRELKDVKTLTTGVNLLKCGYKEGSQIGEILEKLLEEKLNNDSFKNQTDEMIWVKNNF